MKKTLRYCFMALLMVSVGLVVQADDPTYTPIAVLEGHTRTVQQAFMLSSGRVLSWSSSDAELFPSELFLWDVARGTYIALPNSQSENIYGATELHNGHILAWMSTQQMTGAYLRLWDADGGFIAQVRTDESTTSGAMQLADERVLSWGSDAVLRLWSADDLAPLGVLEGHTITIFDVRQLRDGRILSWGAEPLLYLWDVADMRLLAVLDGHTIPQSLMGVRGGLELADGRLLSWSSHWDNVGVMRLWDADGASLGALDIHDKYAMWIQELSNGTLLSASQDGILRLWDATGTIHQTLEAFDKPVGMVFGALELQDGNLLTWSRAFGNAVTVRLRDADGTLIADLGGQTGAIMSAIQLVDGRILTWGGDGTLRLWTADGVLSATWEGHASTINGARQLADGRLLTWSSDETIRLWDVGEG